MKNEEIRSELVKDFNIAEDRVRIPKDKRIFIDVSNDKFEEVLKFLRDKAGFNILCMITGTDDGDSLGMIYHITEMSGTVVNLKTGVSKEKPVIKSIMDLFPSSEIYEREVADLFGFKIEGLPEGSRYPLPDDWPEGQYPLRKDWKSENVKQEDK